MVKWTWAIAGLSVVMIAGCPKNEASKPEVKSVDMPASAPPPVAASAPVAGEAKPTEGEKPIAGEAGGREMANCPSSVEGATTKLEDTADAVVVTVTAQAEAATNEIRKRSKHLQEVSTKNPTEVKHTGEGEGGGVAGNCPVVLADTAVSSEDVPGGAKVVVKPSKAEDLAKLKALAHERFTKMTAEKK